MTNNFTAGILPSFAVGTRAPGRTLMAGDFKLLSQLNLMRFRPDHRIPSISLVLQETLPTGRYDRLDESAQGRGGGAFATTVGLYVQHYIRMRNGRPLRARLNLSESIPMRAMVTDRSVYGTPLGFRGKARLGRTTSVDASLEYSVNRHWVLAMDVLHEQTGAARVSGKIDGQITSSTLAGNSHFAFAPAAEYNWSANDGILLGLRLIPRQRGALTSVTPAISFSRSW